MLTVADNLLPSGDIHAPDQTWADDVNAVHVAPRFEVTYNNPLAEPPTNLVQSLEAARQLKVTGVVTEIEKAAPLLVEIVTAPLDSRARLVPLPEQA